jgi:hypothetical protein
MGFTPFRAAAHRSAEWPCSTDRTAGGVQPLDLAAESAQFGRDAPGDSEISVPA